MIMSNNLKMNIVFLFLMAVTVISFQNCNNSGFKVVPEEVLNTSSNEEHSEQHNEEHNEASNDTSKEHEDEHQDVDPVVKEIPHIMTTTVSIIPNTNIEFKLHEHTTPTTATYSWSHKLADTVGACQKISNETSSSYVIKCSNEGNLTVSLILADETGPIPVEDYVVPVFVSSLDIKLNPIFNIAAGTARRPWNTAATIVETYVGQTLTIKNNDTITHGLHTKGKPCLHGPDFAAGATFNCVISVAYDAAVDGTIYDHLVGTSAIFYLISYDGAVLYEKNCKSCHGDMATSEIKGASYSQIRYATKFVPRMYRDENIMKLTTTQLEAIAYALSK